jgi:hypothetical protein
VAKYDTKANRQNILKSNKNIPVIFKNRSFFKMAPIPEKGFLNSLFLFSGASTFALLNLLLLTAIKNDYFYKKANLIIRCAKNKIAL